MIGLINYDGGNYQSVSNILQYLNINFREINNSKQFKNLSHIILPGVGSFNGVMSKLKINDLNEELIYQVKNKKIFYLGICVGMQLLGNYGLENFKTKGFGLIDGSVEKIPTKNKILPNIGWHNIILENNNSPLFEGIDVNEMFFYFVHSYYFNITDKKHCSSSIYYENKLTASVEKDNIFGVQFHPEKSQTGGLKLLKNFCEL